MWSPTNFLAVFVHILTDVFRSLLSGYIGLRQAAPWCYTWHKFTVSLHCHHNQPRTRRLHASESLIRSCNICCDRWTTLSPGNERCIGHAIAPADKGVDLTGLLGGQKRRLGVWGTSSPRSWSFFCVTTHNICIKIQQTTVAVTRVNILNDITSKILGGITMDVPPS